MGHAVLFANPRKTQPRILLAQGSPTCPGNFLKVSMLLVCLAKNMDLNFRLNFMTHEVVVPLPEPRDASLPICDGRARKVVACVKNDTLGRLGVKCLLGRRALSAWVDLV